MVKQTENEFIAQCLLQIEEKLGWGDASSWHSDVFIELSESIQKETNTLLSPTTLKRIWGKVNYSSSPSTSTLNILARFAGYLNWRDFKNQSTVPPGILKVTKPKFSQGKILGYAAIIGVLIISILLAMGAKSTRSDSFDYSKLEFSSRAITKGLPNSVVFDFDLAGLHSDSIYIQQSWDETKTIKLKAGQTQATGQYYYPGYYRAKLLVEGKIIKEHDLFIKSEGWLGTIDFEPIPKYFGALSITQNNLILPEEAIKEITSSEKPLISSFHFVDDLGDISGDNFKLETSFRNIYNDKWAGCKTTRLIVIGTKGALVIPFSIPGCVSNIGLMLNDVFLSGKEHDLSMFGTDLAEFHNYELRVENKSVIVIIDGQSVYSGRYNESLGRIVGIRFRFLGVGEVDYIRLQSPDVNNYIMFNDFNRVQ